MKKNSKKIAAVLVASLTFGSVANAVDAPSKAPQISQEVKDVAKKLSNGKPVTSKAIECAKKMVGTKNNPNDGGASGQDRRAGPSSCNL
jgi:hypothetical protein